ncbi:hypothetical protein FQN49_002435 [Arthroderma sp. PD_2]|nr:hypothetical protein FQN49_002435 [Arthroderma sp. PD_2]
MLETTKDPHPASLPSYPDYSRLVVMSTVYNSLQKTQLTPAVDLSRRMGCKLFFKREDQQLGFSPHMRGIFNRLSQIPPEDRWRGVVVSDIGHYARATAWSSQLLKMQAVVIVSPCMPDNEVHELHKMGCAVTQSLSPDSMNPLTSAFKHQAPYVNPLNDPYVLAGIGTAGLEILQQIKDTPNLDSIFCSASAGGVLEGIGLSVKQFAPHVKVIGVSLPSTEPKSQVILPHYVESEGSELINSLMATPEYPKLSHDGEMKTEAGRIHSAVVDEVIVVEPEEVLTAIKDVFLESRVIVDLNGALAVAGMKRYALDVGSQQKLGPLVAVISSANITFEQLRTLDGEKVTSTPFLMAD